MDNNIKGFEQFSLKNKVFVVTGATGVLGAAFTLAIAKAGAKVAVLGRNKERAEKRVADIQKAGGEAIAVLADVLNEKELNKAAEEVLKKWGAVNGLVNGAGGNIAAAVVQPQDDIFGLDMDALQQVMHLNLFGTLLPTQVFGEIIRHSTGKGSIVNISSVTAHKAVSKVLGYSLAKAAIESYTKAFALELASRYGNRIRMNALVPGFFLTEQNRSLLSNEDGSYTLRGENVIRNTPFKRFGDPDELTGALIWLLSDASAFVTGSSIIVDGGFTGFSGV